MQLTDSHGNLGEAPLTQIFHNLDPSQFPATVAVADSLPLPFEDEFAFGLDLIIDGLTQALHRERPHGG
jgi:hypothetical protein